MKIKSLLLTFLLFALTVANVNAQTQSASVVQGFESDMNGWTYLCEDDYDSFSYGSISDVAAHEGTHSFRFEGAPYGYGYLVSPVLEFDGGVDLSFFYTNYYDGAASFQVGYTTNEIDVDDVDAFDPDALVWGDIIVANQGTMYNGCTSCNQGWMEYTNDFPKGVKHIVVAFAPNELNLFVDDFSFTETSCAKPGKVEIDATKTRLALNWSGDNVSYEVRYKKGSLTSFEYGFEGWTTIDADGDEFNWTLSDPFDDYEGHDESEYCVYSESVHSEFTQEEHLDPDNFLVSPLVPLGGSITFWAKDYGDGWDYEEHFGVAISTDGNEEADDFETIIEWTAKSDWTKYTVDLSNYSGMGYVAIRHFKICEEDDCALSALCVDDITIFTSADWTVAEADDTSISLDNLMFATNYVIQLRGVCGDNEYSTWTDEIFAMTEDADCRFINPGDWNVEANWKDGVKPGENSDVYIAASAIIPAGVEAVANNIVLGLGSLTMADGGQLKHNNEGLVATMEKTITAYVEDEGKDHYYLFGLPINSSLNPSEVTNMVPENDEFEYDLYYFDQNGDADGKEWMTYKEDSNADNCWFYPTKGFLYARNSTETTVTLSATGELQPSAEDYVIESVPYVDGADFPGWNLISNPFACNAYLVDEQGHSRSFYHLVETADEGSKIELASDTQTVIAPMEGIFVEVAQGGEDITFATTAPQTQGNKGLIEFMLRKANTRSAANVDRTRIVFGEGRNVAHFDIMASPDRLYFPLDDKALAVVYSQPFGELPLNLEVAGEGSFVLAFDCNAENLVYCHLIDNMTGADVDLLQTPSYTFEARTTDYASRFRIVFASNEVDATTETFAFNSNGTWILPNEGQATVQVIDLAGRIVKSEQINGTGQISLNQPAGIYMLRLINGNDVKVQKVVVK